MKIIEIHSKLFNSLIVINTSLTGFDHNLYQGVIRVGVHCTWLQTPSSLPLLVADVDAGGLHTFDFLRIFI